MVWSIFKILIKFIFWFVILCVYWDNIGVENILLNFLFILVIKLWLMIGFVGSNLVEWN